jgi:signal transduction histidine kinase
LAAGVLPSVLAVGLVIGLFYYGEYGHAAPRVILVAAAALTVVSMIVAWANAHYFAERLARIARATEQATDLAGPTDEFDRIERAVGNLGSALTAAEAERVRTDERTAARLKEEATMLAGVVSDAIAQLDEVRLPLQILLESPFGELNENQEELLRDARMAADAIDVALRRLAQVADVDREALPVQHELVQVNDVVRSVLPLARAAAERRGARTETTLEPGLPRVLGDRARLAEALSLFVTHAAEGSSPERALTVGTARDGARAIIRIAPANGDALGIAPTLILGSRLIAAQSGEVSVSDGSLVLLVGFIS